VEHFDAIVVGAGPAGSTAAYRLALAGANVLLLDKAQFPRNKPCGGAISTRALNELPLDPKPVVEHIVDRMELSFRGGRPFVRGKHTPLAYMTQRRRLDHFLIEQAADVGTDFRDNATVTEVSERGARVDGKWIDAGLLIGADGANGSTARSLDLGDPRIYGVALEGNIPHSLTDPDRWQRRVVIELGTIPGGYCWIFPKGDHINVGVGGWENTGPKLRKHLQEFCKRRGFDDTKLQELRGYRLPARRPGAALAQGRALLTGDAAGLVDPLWGDGLYAAFLSAKLASMAALDLLADRVTDLNTYATAVVSQLGLMTAFAWDAKAALDRFPRLALTALISPPVWSVVENMLCGDTRAPDRERCATGIVIRGLETLGRRAYCPGMDYRIEASQPTA
jgi:geranylgeranyl reductase family protein